MLAIAGAGDIAGALARRAASRERFRDIRLIEETGTASAGKALDIRQAGPIDGYDSRVTGHASLDAAAGASVVAIADRFGGAEWEGDAGLAMLARLLPMIGDAPLLFTGANQLWLMEDGVPVPDVHFPGGEVRAWLEGDVGDAAAVAVTVEPAGGSQTPTLPVVGGAEL